MFTGKFNRYLKTLDVAVQILRGCLLNRLLTLIVFMLSLCRLASADINTAAEALNRNDWDAAIPEFIRLAKDGDAMAQAYLGYLYYVGEGVKQDYTTAIEWYRKAAIQGNRDAQYNLAVAYAFGEGAKQDPTEAAIWYRRAAEQGHVISQYSLGISYAYGEGVPQDFKKAAYWFQEAAEHGYVLAQVQLGSLYHKGEGVDQNYTEAARWYRMAADQGDAIAQYNLAALYRTGEGVEKNYAKAKRWLHMAAGQGYAAAQSELANLERTPSPRLSQKAAQGKSSKVETKLQITNTTEQEKKRQPLFTFDGEDLLKIKAKGSAKTEGAVGNVKSYSAAENIPVVTPEQTADSSSATEKIIATKTEVSQGENKVQDDAETMRSTQHETGINIADVDNTALQQQATIQSPGSLIEKTTAMATEESVIKEPVWPKKEQAGQTKRQEVVDSLDQGGSEATKIKVTENIITDAVIPQFEPIKSEIERADGQLVNKASLPKVETLPIVEKATMAENMPTAKEKSGGLLRSIGRHFSSDAEATVSKAVTIAEPYAEIENEPTIAVAETDKKGDVEINEDTVDMATTGAEETTDILVEEGIIDYAMLPKPIRHGTDSKPLNDRPEEDIINADVLTEIQPAYAVEATEEQTAAEITTPVLVEESVIDEPLLPGVETQTITDKTEITVDEATLVKATSETKPTVKGIKKESKSTGLFDFFGGLFSGNKKVEGVKTKIAEKPEIKRSLEINDTGPDKRGKNFESPETQLEDKTVIAATTFAPEQELAKLEERPDFVEPLPPRYDIDLSLYSIDNGRRALLQGNYDDALFNFKPMAEAGNTIAQEYLGAMYYSGKGVEQDRREAYRWYRYAAEHGSMNAQYSIGNMYLLGEGVEQDYDKAAYWYAKSNGQGHIVARQNLKGLKQLQTLTRQNELLQKKSTQQTYLGAEKVTNEDVSITVGRQLEQQTEDRLQGKKTIGNLDDMYLMGDGVKQNNKETVSWHSKVAGQGQEAALENPVNLNRNIKTGAGVKVLNTNAKKIEVSDSVAPATAKKDPHDLYELGLANSLGDGIKQDQSAAFSYFLAAAEKGYAPAQYKTGIAYAYGEGVRKNYAEAIAWYRKAAEQGHMASQRNLATMYLDGKGIEQDKILAMAWLMIIANSGDSMDIYRRDMLQKEMSPSELTKSRELANQISQHLPHSLLP